MKEKFAVGNTAVALERPPPVENAEALQEWAKSILPETTEGEVHVVVHAGQNREHTYESAIAIAEAIRLTHNCVVRLILRVDDDECNRQREVDGLKPLTIDAWNALEDGEKEDAIKRLLGSDQFKHVADAANAKGFVPTVVAQRMCNSAIEAEDSVYPTHESPMPKDCDAIVLVAHAESLAGRDVLATRHALLKLLNEGSPSELQHVIIALAEKENVEGRGAELLSYWLNRVIYAVHPETMRNLAGWKGISGTLFGMAQVAKCETEKGNWNPVHWWNLFRKLRKEKH